MSVKAPGEEALTLIRSAAWYGKANQLSREYVDWPILPEIIVTTRYGADLPKVSRPFSTFFQGPTPKVNAFEVIHQRRSAVAFDATSEISADIFFAMMGRVLAGDHPPWNALCWDPAIHLLLFVHRVKDLPPGLYFLERNLADRSQLREVMRPEFSWNKIRSVPENLPLFFLMEGDVRQVAMNVSCNQSIAGDSFFSLGMIANFKASLEKFGPSFYRNLFWECGVIGQVLYLEAEAHGTRATGIGCYFDDPVHQLMGLTDNTFQSMYHFTVGAAVEDTRLKTSPAYVNKAI